MDVITMTGAAAYCLMPALQWIFGILVMVEPDFFPLCLTMAILTFFAVAAPVHIIDTVATVALGRNILVSLIRVTACARNLLVRTT